MVKLIKPQRNSIFQITVVMKLCNIMFTENISDLKSYWNILLAKNTKGFHLMLKLKIQGVVNALLKDAIKL